MRASDGQHLKTQLNNDSIPMQLIDTHIHINFEVFESDLAATRSRWRETGVVQLVHSMVNPEEFGRIQALARQIPELFFAVGLHPLDADKWTGELALKIEQMAKSDSKVVAIGETGLDFYKGDASPLQTQALEAQLLVAYQLQLPVIIHCREAAATLKQKLEEFWERRGKVKGVMHCWGGTVEQTQWFLELGFYISFSGTVTFKKALGIKESAKIVPSDRLLIETDSPFLAPEPKRGKRNEPAYVLHIAKQLAQLRGVTLETIATQTTENARRLFNLPPVTKKAPTPTPSPNPQTHESDPRQSNSI